ncbi:MAG: hypothetical protein V3V72_13625 [Ignavibacteriaceae bacterium]
MINEILQWIVIVWAVWAIHTEGKAITAVCDSLAEIAKWRDKERPDEK